MVESQTWEPDSPDRDYQKFIGALRLVESFNRVWDTHVSEFSGINASMMARDPHDLSGVPTEDFLIFMSRQQRQAYDEALKRIAAFLKVED